MARDPHRIETLLQSKVSNLCTNTQNSIHLTSFNWMAWHKTAVYYVFILRKFERNQESVVSSVFQ